MIGVFGSVFISFLCIYNKADAQNYDFTKNLVTDENPVTQQKQNIHSVETKVDMPIEVVDLRLYYESLCPACIGLEQTQFKHVVNLLSSYINITTYPYGNAQTIETNGEVEFKCQHGPKECYGNKLHACSLKHIANHTQALLFNICMMEADNETRGSDDASAARCANKMNINTDTILKCAKGKEGIQLLKHYGEESKKANFDYVPYVLINGVEWTQDNDLMHDVCAAFQNPPGVCQK